MAFTLPSQLEMAMRLLRREGQTPDVVARAMERDDKVRERLVGVAQRLADDKRLGKDVAAAHLTMERLVVMRDGDAARGGQRRTLAFATWGEHDAFVEELKVALGVADAAPGAAPPAQAQVVGSAATFYSSSLDHEEKYHFDRYAPRKPSDLTVEVIALPQLADLLQTGRAGVDTRTFDRGDYRYFADSGMGQRIGVLDRSPELRAFVDHWRERLARPVHVRLRLRHHLPDPPGLEAIELYRSEDEDTP
jgi:hypothetical protein